VTLDEKLGDAIQLHPATSIGAQRPATVLAGC